MGYQVVGLVGLILVALTLLGGTFLLLVSGRPVPEAVWTAWGVVITALFGHGVFLAQAQTHQRVIGDVMDAVSVGAGAATTATATTLRNGKGASTEPPGPPTNPGVDSAAEMTEDHSGGV